MVIYVVVNASGGAVWAGRRKDLADRKAKRCNGKVYALPLDLES